MLFVCNLDLGLCGQAHHDCKRHDEAHQEHERYQHRKFHSYVHYEQELVEQVQHRFLSPSKVYLKYFLFPVYWACWTEQKKLTFLKIRTFFRHCTTCSSLSLPIFPFFQTDPLLKAYTLYIFPVSCLYTQESDNAVEELQDKLYFSSIYLKADLLVLFRYCQVSSFGVEPLLCSLLGQVHCRICSFHGL